MVMRVASRPDSVGTPVQCWVLDDATQLQSLRSSLYAALTGQPMPEGGVLDEIPEKIALVATELATNALTHARPPTQVRLHRTEHVFLLYVIDHDVDDPPVARETSSSTPGGVGLHLADDIADDLGWYVEDHTKHVWAEFPIPVWKSESH
ncbi:ATP-binding protein [Actinoplanes sp. NPDC051411]|uniref:ATP-binding protein n=1 Tax=Actinoplanes sp. NPDC051411 TaxID=3155522 RepID=UPI0034152DAB